MQALLKPIALWFFDWGYIVATFVGVWAGYLIRNPKTLTYCIVGYLAFAFLLLWAKHA